MGLIILLLIIGTFGAFVSGLVGIRGSIVIYPLLLFVPPLFGFDISSHTAAGLTASQVFFSTLSGSLSQRKNPDLDKSIIIPMGISILIGSAAGAYSATLFNESLINIVYTILAIIAIILMFVKVKPDQEKDQYNIIFLIIAALIIGYVSGIVGAGGAFIIIPVLLAIFKVPFRKVIASSIVIAFISSIGTFFTKSIAGDVDFGLMIPLVISSIIFAPIGTKVSKMTDQKVLRIILAVMISAAAVKMLFEIF